MKYALQISAEMSGGKNSASLLTQLPDNWKELGQEQREEIARRIYDELISNLVESGYSVVEGDDDADFDNEEDWEQSEDGL